MKVVFISSLMGPDNENQIQTVMRIAKQLGKELQNRFGDRTLTIGQRILELTLLIFSRSDWAATFPTEAVSVPVVGEEMKTKLQGEVYQKADDAPSASEMNQGEADNGITFAMMRDVDYDDTETWNAFLDQMTIEEMASLFPNVQGTSEINSIVLPETHSSDGAMDQMHHSLNY